MNLVVMHVQLRAQRPSAQLSPPTMPSLRQHTILLLNLPSPPTPLSPTQAAATAGPKLRQVILPSSSPPAIPSHPRPQTMASPRPLQLPPTIPTAMVLPQDRATAPARGRRTAMRHRGKAMQRRRQCRGMQVQGSSRPAAMGSQVAVSRMFSSLRMQRKASMALMRPVAMLQAPQPMASSRWRRMGRNKQAAVGMECPRPSPQATPHPPMPPAMGSLPRLDTAAATAHQGGAMGEAWVGVMGVLQLALHPHWVLYHPRADLRCRRHTTISDAVGLFELRTSCFPSTCCLSALASCIR